MSSAAPYRNPPPGPPNDPTWMLLEGRNGWPQAAASNVTISPLDCALVLQNAPHGAEDITDPSGRFGGLVPPPNVALAPDDTVWLLDTKTGRLRRFDDCACAFIDIPHTGGIGKDARRFVAPIGLAISGNSILILDAGGVAAPGRVLLFTRHGFSLRAIWQPPASAMPSPWQPTAFAAAPDGRVAVADAANGVVHVFSRAGQWLKTWPGFGTLTAIAFDRFDRLFTLAQGADEVDVWSPDGTRLASVTQVQGLCGCFLPLPDFASDNTGRINLAGRCAGAGWFGPNGQPSTVTVPVPPIFAKNGTWFSTALDSAIGRCQWHRVVLDLHLPPGTGFALSSYTSEVAQPVSLIQALPPSAWSPVNLLAKPPYEALITSQPGRYLWLQAVFTGNQQATPRLETARIEYPRISLRRYLPRAFGPDPVSADFVDRLLGIFDQGFRSVEQEIDNQADLFDARSAPAVSKAAGAPDMLSWLASWIGLTFGRAWPVAKRRHLLMQAAKLYPCRGTLPGLRWVLYLYLGLDNLAVPRAKAACSPACAPPAPAWKPPPLILEHWKIRRWLFLGAGRLGDDAKLWGETIMDRSQLGNTAQLGATKLDVSLAPDSDPFNVEANIFTVFVPSGLARTAPQQAAMRQLLTQEIPASTRAELRFVQPRMRIGIQACIGFDSVIGCWPEGVVLAQASLGRATVLSAARNIDPGLRVGRSRINPQLKIA